MQQCVETWLGQPNQWSVVLLVSMPQKGSAHQWKKDMISPMSLSVSAYDVYGIPAAKTSQWIFYQTIHLSWHADPHIFVKISYNWFKHTIITVQSWLHVSVWDIVCSIPLLIMLSSFHASSIPRNLQKDKRHLMNIIRRTILQCLH